MKKHLEEIDILRGIAIVMVILYHSIIVFPIDLLEIVWCKTLHDFLWLMEMPLFFIVSGFCFSYKGNYKQYIWKKVKRILIPHFVFCAIDLLPRIIPNNLVHEKTTLQEGLKNLLLYGGTDWFLWTLFLVVAIFPFLHWFMEKGIGEKIMVSLLVLLAYVFREHVTQLFLLATLTRFLIYYLIGYFISKLDYEKMKEYVGNGITAMIALFLLAGSFYAVEQHQLPFEVLLAISGAIVCYYIALHLTGFSQKFLVECGGYSLQMFLLDGYALVLTRTIIVKVLQIQQPLIIIVCNFILDLLIVLIITKYFFTKWKILRVLSGLPDK
ncbi:MAG TPA: acyltransferase [Lachnospiraceae bacterium]|nr:acyltransferase [Lachnospiraceae bacterium]